MQPTSSATTTSNSMSLNDLLQQCTTESSIMMSAMGLGNIPMQSRMAHGGHNLSGLGQSDNNRRIMDMPNATATFQFGQHEDKRSFNSGRLPTTEQSTSPLLKTPVSLLNEICAKAKVNPTFETAEDGPPHDRVFECTVKVERQGLCWEGKGTAKAKKDARQEAAKNLLVSMDNQVEKLLIPTAKTLPEETEPKLDCDPDVPGNPVGELNDLCMKIKRLPPDYEDIGEEGRPHERVYTVTCKLGSQIVENGRGHSKKQAKKIAAYKVKQRLTELMRNGMDVDKSMENKDEADSIVEKIQELTMTNRKLSGNSNKSNWRLKDWFAEFKERTGDKLLALQDPTGTTDSIGCYKKMLNEIAEEQKFKLEYHDVQQQESEEFSAIVSVGMEPVAIFMGKGRSKTEARKNAAEKAIEFLKVAVRK